jgi:lysyl-tRNA synthetase class 1
MSSAPSNIFSVTPEQIEAAEKSKAWPFEEARKLVKRFEQSGYPDTVLFETGYGPSGLPHIGTFGEVLRTTMVQHAFRVLTKGEVSTKLLCFSDDMDGMRKIPDNVPNQDMLKDYLDIPLSRVPNPFDSDASSFADHNNTKLCEFLDSFGFEYEFASSTAYYEEGRFDDMLVKMCQKYQEIMDVMLPSLGEERRATYSPFLPISPSTGHVLYVPMKSVDGENGTITFDDENGEEVTLSVMGGNVKLQWKPDFGMRWAALNVHFEMYGKDHQVNGKIYSKICRILGTRPPEQFVYELFLDGEGQKISKSKGNGISIEDWLSYGTPESLALFMYQKPKTAKRLHFDVIPKHVDEYFSHLVAMEKQTFEEQLNNPTWHIHNGNTPSEGVPVPLSMLLNLVSASDASEKSILWGFISRYADGATAETHPKLDDLVGYAIRYYENFVKPNKTYRLPTEQERAAMEDLAAKLADMDAHSLADELQTMVFSVGKEHGFENLRSWFQALYQVLLGQDQGPRFGSFIALYGVAETKARIDEALSGKFV